jgi:site-specific recombinase XerD
MTAPVPLDPQGATLPAAELELLVDRARSYTEARRAPATTAAYARDWAGFRAWCEARHLAFMPAAPATVALYVTDLADHGFHTSTINRRLAAVAAAHHEAAFDSPAAQPQVKELLKGVRRRLGVAPKRQVAPAVTAQLRLMVEALPVSPIGTRDRALLLVGFAAALRRSELVALDVSDVAETGDGLVLNLRRSKADQEGQGRHIGVPYGSHPGTCPVRALRAWKDLSQLTDGPLWRSINRHGRMAGRMSPAAVGLVVKRSAARAGLNPASYAGHSLRSGLATAAAAAGVSERSIMNQTGHKTLTMVRRYIRGGSLFLDNAAAQVGL